MEFFQGFTVTWAAEGPVADLSEQAVRTGWGFIGQVPPAVEQFNAVHRGDGLRQQWLFNQVKGVTDAAGLTLTSGDTDTLQEALAYQIWKGGEAAVPKSITSASGNDAGPDGHTHALDNTGVNAGTYGTSSAVGRFQVDQKGRITGAEQVDISLPNLSGVLPVGKGGTGATAAPQARSNLGMAPFMALADSLLAASGFVELVNDAGNFRLIIQWGEATVPADSSLRVEWPKVFPNACLNAFSCLGFIFSTTGDAGCSIRDLDAAGGTLLQGTATPGIVRYFAIGY
ncbi:TPA: hypothetical protein UOA92_000311 [Stenotrophomonas maltophilia]|nr:hypothetical protein [Stenotrophomonas maltophilia]